MGFTCADHPNWSCHIGQAQKEIKDWGKDKIETIQQIQMQLPVEVPTQSPRLKFALIPF